MQHQPTKPSQDVNMISPLALAASANMETGVLLLCKEALVTAIQDARLNRVHLKVLACLVGFINTRNAKAWPDRKTIAAALEIDPHTVSNRLGELREMGYLIAERERVAEAGNRSLMVYTFGNIDHEGIRREIQAYVDRIRKVPAEGDYQKSLREGTVPLGGDIQTPEIPTGGDYQSPKVPVEGARKSLPAGHSNSKKELNDKVREDYAPQAAPAKRGTRLGDDWVLPKVWGDWALTEFGVDATQVRREGEHFRDYWIAKPGKDGVKLDWGATWRNWCRNAKWGRARAHSNRMSLELIDEVVDSVFERGKSQKPQGNLRLTDER
jgi:Iron dependent repressor, N-terminal DNA binding domain